MICQTGRPCEAWLLTRSGRRVSLHREGRPHRETSDCAEEKGGVYDRGRHAEYRAAWDALSGALRFEQSGPQGSPPAGGAFPFFRLGFQQSKG